MELYSTLTRSRCDCCGEELVDPVGDLVIWEAVHAYRDELRARAAEERKAWSAAERATEEALK
jgi:hypothetical protein